MKLTREEAVSLHRKMWNWIADRIEEEKAYQDYQDINNLKEEYCYREGFYYVRNDCFCWEYANCNCDFCPIEWGSDLKDYMCLDKYEVYDDKGLYRLSTYETDWKEQVKLARKISNLPERENV